MPAPDASRRGTLAGRTWCAGAVARLLPLEWVAPLVAAVLGLDFDAPDGALYQRLLAD